MKYAIAHHLERGRTRPDDDCRTDLRDRYLAFAQGVADRLARHDVLRVRSFGHQAPDVDHPIYLGRCSSFGEIACAVDFALQVTLAVEHGIDKIKGHADTVEISDQGFRLEHVALDDLAMRPALGPAPAVQLFRGARHGPQRNALVEQISRHVSTHEAG